MSPDVGVTVAPTAARASVGQCRGVRGVVWSFPVTLLSGIGKSNRFLLDTSLFHQMQPAPAVAPDWTSGLTMVVLAAVATGTGAWALRRRDLASE
jgi:hypothetical protein